MYFAVGPLAMLALALVLHVASIAAYVSKSRSVALTLLFLGALTLRAFMAILDPFLNPWDEQFHALVAKSMLTRPGTPTLYSVPVLPYDYRSWVANHVWLHKPPLALWQIALSYGLLGASEVTTRAPSAILGSLLVLLVFRIGALAVNAEVGYFAALLISLSCYQLRLVAGAIPTDHIDVALLFYVAASFWAWLESRRSDDGRWIVLTGVLAGLAVLTKWLPGLLVFGAWATALIADRAHRWDPAAYRRLAVAIGVAFVTFLPWELYTSMVFPQETAYERAYSLRHLFEALEGNAGDSWYHVSRLSMLYGKHAPYVILPALLALSRAMRDRAVWLACLACLLGVYGFFSIAATKMPSFPIIVSPIVVLAMGAFVEASGAGVGRVAGVRWRCAGAALVLVLLSFFGLDLQKIARTQGDRRPTSERLQLIASAETYKRLARTRRSGRYALFNCPPFSHPMAMFYTGWPAYDFIPSEHDSRSLAAQGLTIVVFDDGTLPSYLRDDAQVVKVTMR